jgi:hypothetical protein
VIAHRCHLPTNSWIAPFENSSKLLGEPAESRGLEARSRDQAELNGLLRRAGIAANGGRPFGREAFAAGLFERVLFQSGVDA